MGFLTGKTAIITGAGRAVLSDGSCGSIGYGIATAFAKEGANLVITGRNVKKLEEAKNELEAKYGIRVLPVQADVCAGTDNEATVQNVVNQAVDTFGGIQVLVNNAQASASGVPLAEHTTEQFDLALYSGLYAAFYYMKACYPYLAKSKGSVINFASGAVLNVTSAAEVLAAPAEANSALSLKIPCLGVVLSAKGRLKRPGLGVLHQDHCAGLAALAVLDSVVGENNVLHGLVLLDQLQHLKHAVPLLLRKGTAIVHHCFGRVDFQPHLGLAHLVRICHFSFSSVIFYPETLPMAVCYLCAETKSSCFLFIF